MSVQVVRFALVGSSALLIHWFTVVSLVPVGMFPLLANVVGFMMAFLMSYVGHSYWTFLSPATVHRQCLPRFFLVALCGFILNETLYFLLLTYSDLGYQKSLIVVLGLVSFFTFTLSKKWAFKHA